VSNLATRKDKEKTPSSENIRQIAVWDLRISSFMTNQTPQKCLAGFSLRWSFDFKTMREILCRSGAVRLGSRLMFAMLCLTGMTALAAPPARLSASASTLIEA
jgi:hypothetical protein